MSYPYALFIMDFKELKKKDMKELQALLGEKREAVRALRIKAALDEYKQVREIRAVRKDVARIITLINQRRIQGKS